MRVRCVRNFARGEHHDDDDGAVQQLKQQLFGNRGGFLDDGHVVFAGLELKLLTADVIREHGCEESKRFRHATECRSIDIYGLRFSPGSEAKRAMADLFWEGRDFEWVVPDDKLNQYWKAVNKRVRSAKYCSFARQNLELTDVGSNGTFA